MNIQIIIYFSLLFLISELFLMWAKRSKTKTTKSQADKKSLIVFWIAIPLSISIGFMQANYQVWTAQNKLIAYVGLGIMLVGMIVRWKSIMQLKKDFTVDVAITESHQLQTDGMYKNMRHPSYLGLLLVGIGLAIAMNSIVSVLVISIVFYFAIMYRIKVEERILLNEFGNSYKKYISKTTKMWPF